MSYKSDKLLEKSLNAQELLRNKGITRDAWDEWEKAARALPKTGKKQFEPSGSWLQNKQIEKGLLHRKELLEIERVERYSQLAAAEWLPMEKKAHVTKRSGQEWTNFGQEVNSKLYLLPEEAMLMLELNCLELTWNGVALSIQQAYDILINADDTQCSMEEYRVYSQLMRQGYRLQRFSYDRLSADANGVEKSARSDLTSVTRRKILVDPKNGLRMEENSRNSTSAVCSEGAGKKRKNSTDHAIDVKDSEKNGVIGNAVEDAMEYIVYRVAECDVSALANNGDTRSTRDNEEKLPPEKVPTSRVSQNTLNDQSSDDKECKASLQGSNSSDLCKEPVKKARNSKVQIISEETVLDNIKVVSYPEHGSKNILEMDKKWPGSRILRNVKLLPKNNNKPSFCAKHTKSSDVSAIDTAGSSASEIKAVPSTSQGEQVEHNSNHSDKRKASPPHAAPSQLKKSKHEIIELSDDEVEEILPRMSRMEMLNSIPNMAVHQEMMREKIQRRYLPRNVRPQKTEYHYLRSKLEMMPESDRLLRHDARRAENTNGHHVGYRDSAANSRIVEENSVLPFHNRNLNSNWMGSPFLDRPFASGYRHSGHSQMPVALRSGHSNLLPFSSSSANFFNRNPFLQHSTMRGHETSNYMYQSSYRGTGRGASFTQNREFSVQMNNYINITQNITSTSFQQNYLPFNFFNNFALLLQQTLRNPWQQQVIQRRYPSAHNFGGNSVTAYNSQRFSAQQQRPYYNYSRRYTDSSDNYKPAFRVLPGSSSWAELKKKWIEEKTITIDDDDGMIEYDDVEVVEQPVKPLVNVRNAKSIAEVFERMRIIKPAQEKSVRKRKSDYKISFNVYSSTQNFKKANPGPPICRIVVIRQANKTFLQPVDLTRLHQDGKGAAIILAYVTSTSISFVQPGVVHIPNLW